MSPQNCPFSWGRSRPPTKTHGSFGLITMSNHRDWLINFCRAHRCPTDRQTDTQTTLHQQQYATPLHSVHAMVPCAHTRACARARARTHARTHAHTHTHTHTHPFNGFFWATQVSQYQKGKTNLDFTEARDSEWQ